MYSFHENPGGHFTDLRPIADVLPYMHAKFTPLTLLTILPHVSGSIARYIFSEAMPSEMKGLATLWRATETPACQNRSYSLL